MKSNRLIILLLLLLLVATGAFYFYQNYSLLGGEEGAIILAKKERLGEKEEVKIGVSRLPKGIYPEVQPESSELNYSSHIFETLVAFDSKGHVVPLLAAKWNNPDDYTWRFYLSPKAKFSNEKPVLSSDVKFSYEYIKNSSLPIKESLPAIDQINVIDDKTVEIKTIKPNPLLLNQLATGAIKIISKEEVEKNGIKNYIGSGPYKLVRFDGQSLKLTRNENYWGQKPKVKNVTFKLYEKEEDKITALLNQEIDFTTYGYASKEYLVKLSEAAKEKKIQLKKKLEPTIVYLDLNSTKEDSPLNNVKVRKAIYYALNMDEILKGSNVEYAQANQLVSQGIFGYNPDILRLPYNLDKAKGLMKEAGYENGFDITIDCFKDPRSEPIFQKIVNQLAAINIKATLNSLEWEQYFAKLEKHSSDALFGAFSSDILDASEALESLIHTTTEEFGLYNLGYSNSKVDRLIEEAGATLKQNIRKQKLQEAMKIAMDDVAKIPLFQTYTKYALADDLAWQPRLDGAIRAYEMAKRIF